MVKSIIIIGAGVAGLSAGCYGRMNGYETRIFEMHDKPGGLCTSWRRKGYTFDGCIHWLVGSGKGSPFRKVWDELGALEGRQIVGHEEFWRYEGEGGRTLVFYTQVDRLEQHLKDLAPGDAPLIAKLAEGIRRFAKIDLPADTLNLVESLKMGWRILPMLGRFREFSSTSVQDFANRLTDPFLQEALLAVTDLPHFPLIGLIFPLSLMNKGDAGYPVGGSLDFARAIEHRYLDLGGDVRYQSRVTKILVENDRAVGVRLADGTEHRADCVISAADGHATIFEMLEGRYTDDRIRGYYSGKLEPFPPLVQVSLGVARNLAAEPQMVYFRLPEPVLLAGKELRVMSYKHYAYDPTLAPAGKSVLVVSFSSDYDYWRKVAEDRSRYENEKEDIAKKVVAQLDRRFPGLAGQVEALDVATPLTYERYTGNWRASFEGWLLSTASAGLMDKTIVKTLPGLAGFHMIGQWTMVGAGLPTVAKDGRDVIKAICREDGKPFVTAAAA